MLRKFAEKFADNFPKSRRAKLKKSPQIRSPEPRPLPPPELRGEDCPQILEMKVQEY